MWMWICYMWSLSGIVSQSGMGWPQRQCHPQAQVAPSVRWTFRWNWTPQERLVDAMAVFKRIIMWCRTSHRALRSERYSGDPSLRDRPERRRRYRVRFQHRGRHPSSTRQRHTETCIYQILRHNGRTVLPHHDRRSNSADDCTLLHVTWRPVRRNQHQHRRYSQIIYVVH